MLEMIARFGPTTTLDLLLTELQTLRAQLSDAIEIIESFGLSAPERAPLPFDAPGQMTLDVVDRAA